MSLTFLSPLAGLVVLAVLLPIGALALRERRHGRIRGVLGLEAPMRRAHLPVVAALAVAFGLLAAAAAQPVVRLESAAAKRTDAEAYVLVDTTRSMLASSAPDEPMRIERASDMAVQIRGALPDVPFGIASLTNRPLPHLFPTTGLAQFELVARRAIGVNRPPGTSKTPFLSATDFESLDALATDNFFSPGATKRLVILLSDGESGEYAVRSIVEQLRRGGVELIVLRLWGPDERVWRQDGTPEPGYVPSSYALPVLAQLAALTTGGRVYGEDEVREVSAAARRYLGRGPAVDVAVPGRTVSLGAWAVLAACVPLAALLLPSIAGRRWSGVVPVRRLARPGLGSRRLPGRALRRSPSPDAPDEIAYSMLPRWPGFSRSARLRSRGVPALPPPSSSAPRSSTGGSSPGSA